MLDQLPTEIVVLIASHLPNMSAILNLALTNQKLHGQISCQEDIIFRLFVRKRFPTIRTPPFWKEASRLLTAQKRAWDRRAFLARALPLPEADSRYLGDYSTSYHHTQRYRPALDSYETWTGSTWAERRQVLAVGAGGRLVLRIRHGDGRLERLLHSFPNDDSPDSDILDVHLLRPHQRVDPQAEEEAIVRRADFSVGKLRLSRGHVGLVEQVMFDTEETKVRATSLSQNAQPLLAVCTTDEIRVFDGTTKEGVAQPKATATHQQTGPLVVRCTRFIDDHRLAIGGKCSSQAGGSPLAVYRIRYDDVSATREDSFDINVDNGDSCSSCTNVIAALDQPERSISRPGLLFLSGWSDGIARLYDTRAPRAAAAKYVDSVDDGAIFSLQPIGCDKFLAGGAQNACLKTFDFRMPGARPYSKLELEAGLPEGGCTAKAKDALLPPATATAGKTMVLPATPIDASRRVNVFLSVDPHRSRTSFREQLNRYSSIIRYRGSIDCLTSPSAVSPTVYAGVPGQVVQFDFLSTEDFVRRPGGIDLPTAFGLDSVENMEKDDGSSTNNTNDLGGQERILNLSCYERPRPGHESTDAVLLRHQIDFDELEGREYAVDRQQWRRKHARGRRQGPVLAWQRGYKGRAGGAYAEDGWDKRWRLATF